MAFVLIFGKYSQRRAVKSYEISPSFGAERFSLPAGCGRLQAEDILRHKADASYSEIKGDLNAAGVDFNSVLAVDSPETIVASQAPPAIYAINSKLDESIAQSIVITILNCEKNREQKRRFAIIFYDQTGKEQNFLEEVRKSKSFSEGYPSFERHDKEKFDALESEKSQKKLSGAKWKFVLSPAFWLVLECAFIGICCLVQYLDPTYLLQSSTGAGFLGFAVSFCRVLTALALIGVPIYSLIMDYWEKGRYYPSGTYLSNSFLRLRNWVIDHKLQAGFICLGLIGSLIALTLTLALGIDSPFFEFIGNAIADPGQYLSGGWGAAFPHEFFVNIGKYVAATIFVLAPSLGFGLFARNAVVLHESRVAPDLDEDVSERRLTEDGRTEVRYHDHRKWYVLKPAAAEKGLSDNQLRADVFNDGKEERRFAIN